MRRLLASLLGAVLVSAFAALLQPVGALAQGGERIVDFESRIEVHGDATMTVRETITVESAGRKIKRGIYRDFPTTYRDDKGRTVIVGRLDGSFNGRPSSITTDDGGATIRLPNLRAVLHLFRAVRPFASPWAAMAERTGVTVWIKVPGVPRIPVLPIRAPLRGLLIR